MRYNHGFTLIEVMVALVIFAIVGLLASLSLHAVIQSNQHLKIADRQLQQLEVTMALMRRDVSQSVMPPMLTHGENSSLDLIIGRQKQKIQYVLNHQTLSRVIDGESMLILQNVSQLEWQLNPVVNDGHSMPKAVLLVMKLARVGTIQGVFPVISRGMVDAQT